MATPDLGVDEHQVAECLGLGRLVEMPTIVASGWGGRNHVWRFTTSGGVFAIKETIAELLHDNPTEECRIETLAFAGGVSAAEPITSVSGNSYELVSGRHSLVLIAMRDGRSFSRQASTRSRPQRHSRRRSSTRTSSAATVI